MLFIYERAPPLVFFLLAILPTASGLKLSEGFIDYEKLAWGTVAYLVSIKMQPSALKGSKTSREVNTVPRGFHSFDLQLQ